MLVFTIISIILLSLVSLILFGAQMMSKKSLNKTANGLFIFMQISLIVAVAALVTLYLN
jgi:hypothetical protein